MSKLLLTCLGCSQDFDATNVNCPSCVPAMTPEHARHKEAHVVRAIEAALSVAGIANPKDVPLTMIELEELPQEDEKQPKRFRQVTVDNTKAHSEAHARHRLAHEAALRDPKAPFPRAEHRTDKEAHVVLGDSIALGHRIKRELEAAKKAASSARDERITKLAALLEKDPANAITLAPVTPADELGEAAKIVATKIAGKK